MVKTIMNVKDLSVSARTRKNTLRKIVEGITFSVDSGKVLALIGESGSGKSTIALACLGFARAGCAITDGSIHLDGASVLDMDRKALEKLRGTEISYVAQSAFSGFNGALTINQQVIETAVIKGLMSKEDALDSAVGLYRELDLPNPETIGNRYPHQLSGGQLQRAMVAMAMICRPKLLILDEPTTALDVTTQIEVLQSLKKLIRDKHTSALYISHDLAVVAQIADEILVLKDGNMVECNSTKHIISVSRAEYTGQLLDAVHTLPKKIKNAVVLKKEMTLPEKASQEKPLVKVDKVTAGYGSRSQHIALKDVSLKVYPGETVGVIGESGSGKTTLGRVISGLMKPVAGSVALNGNLLKPTVKGRSRTELRQIQFAFQSAELALNPQHTVKELLTRPLRFYHGMETSAIKHRVAELLELVELSPKLQERLPRALSGGQQQRVSLARALAAEPELIICDEITSGLDTIVSMAVLKLLKDLQRRLNVAYLFITHDLSIVSRIANRVAVMQTGKIVDYGETGAILRPPYSDYTGLLVSSVPELRTDWLDELMATRLTACGDAINN